MIMLITIGLSCIVLALVLCLYLLAKKPRLPEELPVTPIPIEVPTIKPATKFVLTASDISCIAGDDIMATRLDLARAYLETGKRKLAKQILESVAKQGSVAQQEEALSLLSTL